jgi:hypothetical protein
MLLGILREKIHDNRFIRLVENLLKAGYLEEWKYNSTFSGTPQGGIISPILSNIYLDRLDQYVEQKLLPRYTQGEKRKGNGAYRRILKKTSQAREMGNREETKELKEQLRQLPSQDPNDPQYRRLRYIRYADDFLLGFAGPKTEAEEIKAQIGNFLREELRLEMSEEKTLITHALTERARFLGYEIVSQHENTKLDRNKKRSTNGVMGLRLPVKVVERKCALYMEKGKPIHRVELVHESDYDILSTYQAEYRGMVNYYLLAQNVCWLSKLQWAMETSLLKTLATKHQTSINRMADKYRATVQTDHGPRKCLEVRIEREGKKPLMARFGGIPLRRQADTAIKDQADYRFKPERVELSQRLRADECEICGSSENVEVHHIRALKDLKKPGRKDPPLWVQIMAARNRKTLVVCQDCHEAIHAGKPTRQENME